LTKKNQQNFAEILKIFQPLVGSKAATMAKVETNNKGFSFTMQARLFTFKN